MPRRKKPQPQPAAKHSFNTRTKVALGALAVAGLAAAGTTYILLQDPIEDVEQVEKARRYISRPLPDISHIPGPEDVAARNAWARAQLTKAQDLLQNRNDEDNALRAAQHLMGVLDQYDYAGLPFDAMEHRGFSGYEMFAPALEIDEPTTENITSSGR